MPMREAPRTGPHQPYGSGASGSWDLLYWFCRPYGIDATEIGKLYSVLNLIAGAPICGRDGVSGLTPRVAARASSD